MIESDISLEPLFNQSSEGNGTNKRLAFTIINSVGVASHRTAVAVTNTPQEITIGVGKKTIEIHNSGSNIIYYGGSGVSNTTGIPLYPNSTKIFANVKDSFSIYIVAESGKNSSRKIVEYA